MGFEKGQRRSERGDNRKKRAQHLVAETEFDVLDPFVPEKESFRPAKIANRIREELILLVPDSLQDPRARILDSLVITDVWCAPDLRNARVSFSLFGEKPPVKESEQILNKAAGFLRREIHEKLGIKYTPLLSFHFDRGFQNASRVNTLLTSIRHEA